MTSLDENQPPEWFEHNVNLNAYKEFLEKNYNIAVQKAQQPKTQPGQEVKNIDLKLDFDDLMRFTPEEGRGIDLATRMEEQPSEELVIYKKALESYSPNADMDITIELINPPDYLKKQVREIRSKDINKLISVKGTIKKASEIIPKIKIAHYECARCGAEMNLHQPEENLKEPHQCVYCEREGPFDLKDRASK
ncbi:MAG: hypothetical protein ABEI78_01555 [Candidatus Nanohaloarchaea archaeon]